MEKVWTVKEIAERYKVTMQCARNYIRKMPHMESPLMVYESDLRAWEQSRMLYPAGHKAVRRQGPLIVPRTR